jgi:hypothetical protein
VYQIGDVQARSITVIWVPGSGFTPQRLASYAVRRGVGISINRA